MKSVLRFALSRKFMFAVMVPLALSTVLEVSSRVQEGQLQDLWATVSQTDPYLLLVRVIRLICLGIRQGCEAQYACGGRACQL